MLAHDLGGLFEKVRRFTQVDADQFAVVSGVPGDRHHQSQVMSCTTKHTRYMNQRRQVVQIHQRTHGTLRALPVKGVKQLLVAALQ